MLKPHYQNLNVLSSIEEEMVASPHHILSADSGSPLEKIRPWQQEKVVSPHSVTSEDAEVHFQNGTMITAEMRRS